jgi:hypothetical protein
MALAACLAAGLAACAGGSATPSPAGATTPPPTGPATASPSSEPAFACVMPVVVGVLPGDRLVGVEVSTEAGFDRIAFRFAPSAPGSAAPLVAPTGELREARPPFVQGASGLPLDVNGDRFVSIVFRDMILGDDQGDPTYDGPTDLRPSGPAIRHVVLSEAFEGVVSWIVGLSEAGCLRVGRDATTATIRIDVASP